MSMSRRGMPPRRNLVRNLEARGSSRKNRGAASQPKSRPNSRPEEEFGDLQTKSSGLGLVLYFYLAGRGPKEKPEA